MGVMLSYIGMLCVLVILKSEITTGVKYINVALHKPTHQINTLHDGHDSSKAVDGDRTQSHKSRACTHTRSRRNTWWMVDLLYVYDIHTIQMTNRNSDVYRLQDFYIYVSTDNPLPIPAPDKTFTGQLCLHYPGIFPHRGPHKVHCEKSVKGRYVYVWKQLNSYLTLCEFEVLVKTKTEMTCPILIGRRLSLDSIFSKRLQYGTITHCMEMCVSSSYMFTSVHVNKMSNKCECYHHIGMDQSSSAVIVDPEFDLCLLSEQG